MVSTALLATGLAATAAHAAEPASAFSSTPLKCAQANARVNDIQIMGATAYLGGSFTQLTGPNGQTYPRAGAAAIKTSTCEVLDWNPSVSGEVFAIAPTSNAVYLGGKFRRVNEDKRINLAAVDPASGVPITTFAPTVNGPIAELAATDTTLFAAGGINSVNGTVRGNGAAFTLATGALTGWNPMTDKKIDGLAVSSNGLRVYIGGNFSTVRGDGRGRHLTAVSASTGAVDTAFRPDLTVRATEIRVVGDLVAVGFAGSGGQLGAFDETGKLKVHGQVDGNAQAVAVRGDELVGGGHWGNFCADGDWPCDTNMTRRTKALSLKVSPGVSKGELTGFAPQFNSTFGVWALAYDPLTGRLFAGGDFTEARSTQVAHLAAFAS
jgi:hypothetical protein